MTRPPKPPCCVISIVPLTVAYLAARSMHLQCTIQDGGLWVSDAAQNVQIEPVQVEPVALKVREA